MSFYLPNGILKKKSQQERTGKSQPELGHSPSVSAPGIWKRPVHGSLTAKNSGACPVLTPGWFVTTPKHQRTMNLSRDTQPKSEGQILKIKQRPWRYSGGKKAKAWSQWRKTSNYSSNRAICRVSIQITPLKTDSSILFCQ